MTSDELWMSTVHSLLVTSGDSKYDRTFSQFFVEFSRALLYCRSEIYGFDGVYCCCFCQQIGVQLKRHGEYQFITFGEPWRRLVMTGWQTSKCSLDVHFFVDKKLGWINECDVFVRNVTDYGAWSSPKLAKTYITKKFNRLHNHFTSLLTSNIMGLLKFPGWGHKNTTLTDAYPWISILFLRPWDNNF